jgi:hypothetical protein
MMISNPDKKFQVQVLLKGYEEDSLQSSPELTEIVYDSIPAQYDKFDSLGQAYKADTIIVRTIFHNDRTQEQAAQIVEFLKSSGVDSTRISGFSNAIPATLPEDKKLIVKAVVQ